MSDFRCPIGSFFTSLPKFGIPVETEKFLMKLLLKQNSCCEPRFPLSAICYKIVDSQTSFTLC